MQEKSDNVPNNKVTSDTGKSASYNAVSAQGW